MSERSGLEGGQRRGNVVGSREGQSLRTEPWFGGLAEKDGNWKNGIGVFRSYEKDPSYCVRVRRPDMSRACHCSGLRNQKWLILTCSKPKKEIVGR